MFPPPSHISQEVSVGRCCSLVVGFSSVSWSRNVFFSWKLDLLVVFFIHYRRSTVSLIMNEEEDGFFSWATVSRRSINNAEGGFVLYAFSPLLVPFDCSPAIMHWKHRRNGFLLCDRWVLSGHKSHPLCIYPLPLIHALHCVWWKLHAARRGRLFITGPLSRFALGLIIIAIQSLFISVFKHILISNNNTHTTDHGHLSECLK